MSEKKKKVRVEFRKNRAKPPRENDLTRDFQAGAASTDETRSSERVRAKGDVSRYRTVLQGEADAETGMPAVSNDECVRGRVIRVHGLASVVEADDGRIFRCAVRRLLKTLATDERSVVTTGDIVWLRPASQGVVSGQSSVVSKDKTEKDAIEDETEGTALLTTDHCATDLSRG